MPSSSRLTAPDRVSSPIAVVTDGRWAPTRSASRWWESGSGTAMPSGSHASPALGQVPEGQLQAVINALVVGDGKRDSEGVGPAGAAGEQLQPELGPWVHPRHEPVVQHRQTRWLEHVPPHLGLDMGAIGIPVPRPQHVADPEQLDARASEHIDLSGEQAVDDQEAAVVLVRLGRAQRVPLPGREPALAGERLAPGTLALGFVEQLGQVRVGVDDADEIGHRAHAATLAQDWPTRPQLRSDQLARLAA